MHVCFYAAVRDRALFELVEFYRQDIDGLRSLGHKVTCVNRPGRLGRADLYWVWWQTSGAPAVLASKLYRRPCILVTALSDQDQTASGMGSKSVFARCAAKYSLAHAGLVLACSADARAGLERHRRKRLWTAPLGIDTAVYQPAPHQPTDRPLVVTISHLTEDNFVRKRLLDVIHAAGLLRDVPAEFVIIGRDGGRAEDLRREIQRLGLDSQVTLAGSLPLAEKLELLQRATVYLQPTQYEAFGVAIGEAMACGTPVLSTAVGNVPELVGDCGVLLLPEAGPEALAVELRHMLSSPNLEDLGNRARRRIEERYSKDARRDHIRRAISAVTSEGAV